MAKGERREVWQVKKKEGEEKKKCKKLRTASKGPKNHHAKPYELMGSRERSGGKKKKNNQIDLTRR